MSGWKVPFLTVLFRCGQMSVIKDLQFILADEIKQWCVERPEEAMLSGEVSLGPAGNWEEIATIKINQPGMSDGQVLIDGGLEYEPIFHGWTDVVEFIDDHKGLDYFGRFKIEGVRPTVSNEIGFFETVTRGTKGMLFDLMTEYFKQK